MAGHPAPRAPASQTGREQSVADYGPGGGAKDERPGQVIGYACWGPRELSGNGNDLYWICADPAVHSKGAGRALMQASKKKSANGMACGW